ncbi:ribonuclease H family protein, partial [Providencia rettgeri]
IKVNTDGASRGNPGRSSWAFCVRDERRDVIQVQARKIEDIQSTNTEAEALAILQALRYLKDNQWDQIRIEIDSLLLKNSIQRK